ncbi:MAG: SDR family NAD(P)-dependent oxidoreductase [Candidatus Methylacidiphilales bacterium]
MRLAGKVILVTGSTTGIGEAMARLFVEEGALVMVHGLHSSDAPGVAAELGDKAGFVSGDLADPATPARVIAAALEQLGRLDCIVNNAAAVTRGNLENTQLADFDRTLAVNLRAPFLLIQAALPHFLQHGGGRVLNIGSINSYCGEANQLAYSISKGGLTTLTRNLADAHGPNGIRVNQLNVGWTLTANEFQLKQTEGLSSDWPSKLPTVFAPSGRLLSPREVAWAAVYFLSDEAALVNGAVVDLEQYPVIGRNPRKETRN